MSGYGRSVERLLCLRLRSMGDVVLMTPALRALRQGIPSARIVVGLDQSLGPLLEGHPDVDGILPLGPGHRGKLAFAARMIPMRFDAVLNFHGGPTSAWLTAVSGAKVRVGRDSYRFRFLYTDLAGPPEVLFRDPKAIHTVHNQAALVAALNLPVADFSLHLSVAEKARERLRGRLAALDLPPEGYIVLQPTASWPSKQWPQERFLEAARLLTASTGRRVVVSLPEKSPIPRAMVPGLGSLSRRRHKSQSSATLTTLETLFAGEIPVLSGLPLDEMVALMQGAALYLGNDSGPMHVAAALGIPAVVVFGSSNPDRWHPWGVPYRRLWAGLACSPCHGRSCANPERFACLTRIEVRAVVDAAAELLSSPRTVGSASSQTQSTSAL